MSAAGSLFTAPDRAQLRRHAPRIVVRASALVVIPVLLALLARSLDLYPVIASLPLPLDFLAVGPFAYEGKVVAAIAATILGVGYLMPKRASHVVLGVAVGGILWTGHVFIALQWARLFAPSVDFRQDALPGVAEWTLAALLLVAGVVAVLLENLIDTRAQQRARGLDERETDAAMGVTRRALGWTFLLAAGIALSLGLAYAALHALLRGVAFPFRLNPVLVLFALGIVLAVLVALAARRGSPVDSAEAAAKSETSGRRS